MAATLYNLLEILIVLVPILLAVAFMTIIERKVIGSMQRRIGPNVVGYYGLLQPFRLGERLHFVKNECEQNYMLETSNADQYNKV